ncbi:MAG: insulinase family protein [Treponemataceae bacterium]|nr:insulinase family protein [Treponemataceae bacterium]
MPIIQQNLQNKAILITEPIATSKTVAIGFWFSAGSRYEIEGKHGISHFVEHMLFKGTKKRSCFEIACEFDKMGGYINAFTEREQLCLYCVLPGIYCNEAFEILCDMVNNSTFPSEEIEKERSVIQSEIIAVLDDPEEVSNDAVFSSIWKNNSISLNIAGSLEDVASLKREDLVSWYEEYIKSGKLLVTVSGNFDQEKIVSSLNKMPERKNFNLERKLEKPSWNSSLDFIKADFQQEQYFYLYPISFPLSFEKNIGYSILNAIIGDTMSSRLFQKLREESGYCYNVYSFFNVFDDCGFWAFYATSSKEKSYDVARDLIKIVRDFFINNITEEEINFAKQHLVGEEIMASEDMEQRMKALARNYFSGYELMDSEKIIKIINETPDKILYEILEEFSKKSEKSFIIYGPRVKNSIAKKIQKVFQ